jgi:hypothetical protein
MRPLIVVLLVAATGGAVRLLARRRAQRPAGPIVMPRPTARRP